MLRCTKLQKFKKRHHFFTTQEAVLIRKSDGSLWISDYHPVNPYRGLLDDEPLYYFRGCRRFRDGYIVNYLHVWEHNNPHAFEVYDNPDGI